MQTEKAGRRNLYGKGPPIRYSQNEEVGTEDFKPIRRGKVGLLGGYWKSLCIMSSGSSEVVNVHTHPSTYISPCVFIIIIPKLRKVLWSEANNLPQAFCNNQKTCKTIPRL